MSVQDIYNFVQIDDCIATAGQPTEAQFRDARESGYDVVINLAPDGLQTSLPDEAGLLASLGIAYHHIPVDWRAPGLDDLACFMQAMQAAEGRRTLIHCQANYRVTVFFAVYAQAMLGWDKSRADRLIDSIWTTRPGFQMDDTWKTFLATARNLPTP